MLYPSSATLSRLSSSLDTSDDDDSDDPVSRIDFKIKPIASTTPDRSITEEDHQTKIMNAMRQIDLNIGSSAGHSRRLAPVSATRHVLRRELNCLAFDFDPFRRHRTWQHWNPMNRSSHELHHLSLPVSARTNIVDFLVTSILIWWFCRPVSASVTEEKIDPSGTSAARDDADPESTNVTDDENRSVSQRSLTPWTGSTSESPSVLEFSFLPSWKHQIDLLEWRWPWSG